MNRPLRITWSSVRQLQPLPHRPPPTAPPAAPLPTTRSLRPSLTLTHDPSPSLAVEDDRSEPSTGAARTAACHDQNQGQRRVSSVSLALTHPLLSLSLSRLTALFPTLTATVTPTPTSQAYTHIPPADAPPPRSPHSSTQVDELPQYTLDWAGDTLESQPPELRDLALVQDLTDSWLTGRWGLPGVLGFKLAGLVHLSLARLASALTASPRPNCKVVPSSL